METKDTKNKYDLAEAYAFAKRKEGYFKLLNAVNFSDLNIIAPELNIYQDDVQFFDSLRNEIHLGTNGICNIFGIEDQEEFYNAMLYIQGHEEQHRRSTASIPYERAAKKGLYTVIEYIASVEEKKPIRFRNEKDYKDYVEVDLRDKGILLNLGGMRQIIAGIANSLEDGRIERIRSKRLPGFSLLRVYFRGKFWQNNPAPPKYELIKDNPVVKLRVLCSQILSLATCQLYSRDFLKEYASTPLFYEVQEMMPYIAKAVMSGAVRGLEPCMIGICKVLAPYIYASFRLSEADVKAAEELKELIAEMIKQMVDSMPSGMPLEERDEDTDEGGADSTFEHSDLVITLPDDVYDKLMEKQGKKEGGGLMVRREHPENQKDDEQSSDGDGTETGAEGAEQSDESEGDSSSETGNKKDSKNASGSETGDKKGGKNASGSEAGDKKGGKNASGSEAGDKKGDKSASGSEAGNKKGGKNASDSEAGNKKGGENAAGPEESNDSNNEEDSKDAEEGQSSSLSANGTHNKAERKGEASREKKEGVSDREKAIAGVLKAIEDAKNATHEKAKDEIRSVNEGAGHAKKTDNPIVPDTDPTLTMNDVKDAMEGTGFKFVEVKRSYPVDRDMPPVIAARGKTLHKKMEKYFRSLRSPSIRNLDSGLVDPSRLYGLAIGDTDVFRKRGKDKVFDGCAYILIDNSGSMTGQKFKEAVTAAAIIEEGFRGLFPIKIVAFDDDWSTVRHQVIKGWDESLKKNCAWNYGAHSHPQGGNADGCSIAVATKELLKRRERKKLLVVLSDGAPTEGSSDPVALTKTNIGKARKKKIQVSGIYFEIGSIDPNGDAKIFHECYQKDYVLCPLSNLDRELEKVLIKFSRS